MALVVLGAAHCLLLVETAVACASLLETIQSSSENYLQVSATAASLAVDEAGVSTGLPGLLNEGEKCDNHCLLQPGNCNSFCGTGQCCNGNDAWLGVPGCETATQQTKLIRRCGHFEHPHQQPLEFRLPEPQGTASTPPASSVQNSNHDAPPTGRLMDIEAGPEDHAFPHYTGSGGQPWSPYEMRLVRDKLLREIRAAKAEKDEVGGPKMVRLAFHDCLGDNGCDGCIDWTDVGTDLCGNNPGECKITDREFEDHERSPNNNGLRPIVEFLEFVFTFDFGIAENCWQTPGYVAKKKSEIEGTITVNNIQECQDECQKTQDCAFFTVYDTGFMEGVSSCKFYTAEGLLTAKEEDATSKNLMTAGPSSCDPLSSWSLKSRNKSRADLWAFASLLAVEQGIERHNAACNGTRQPHGSLMCVQRENETGCEIWPSRPFSFKTGRKDCDTNQDQPYKAEETDNVPDEHLNGPMVVSYMEEHFNFSAKETVTIMGAHTLGRFHDDKSAHKYVWTTDWQAFNNQYYRNIAGRDDWFFDDSECTKVGDAWGNKGRAVWVAKMNQAFRTGGPVQWIQKKVVCPNCKAKKWLKAGKQEKNTSRTQEDKACCTDVPDDNFCHPDGNGQNIPAFLRDPDFFNGCEYTHFIPGRDETALSSDMGLMYSFDVDDRGFPSGCPGLENFHPSTPKTWRFSDGTCNIHDVNDPNYRQDDWTAAGCPANCAKQTYKYHDDPNTTAEHVEHFADNQDAWVEEFVPTMEKMLANRQDDLVVSWPIAIEIMLGDDVVVTD